MKQMAFSPLATVEHVDTAAIVDEEINISITDCLNIKNIQIMDVIVFSPSEDKRVQGLLCFTPRV